MQIPSARTTTYSHRKQRVSPSVSHLSRRVSSRLARQSPNQPEPHASHPLVARPSPAGRLHRRRARVPRAHSHPPRHESPSRARRARAPTRVIHHHPAASHAPRVGLATIAWRRSRPIDRRGDPWRRWR